MKEILTLSATIILGLFMFGLLFYSFYIVLVSKDVKDGGEIPGETVNHPEQEKAAAAFKVTSAKPAKNLTVSEPPDKSPSKSKHKRRRAA